MIQNLHYDMELHRCLKYSNPNVFTSDITQGQECLYFCEIFDNIFLVNGVSYMTNCALCEV